MKPAPLCDTGAGRRRSPAAGLVRVGDPVEEAPVAQLVAQGAHGAGKADAMSASGLPGATNGDNSTAGHHDN